MINFCNIYNMYWPFVIMKDYKDYVIVYERS